MHKENVHLHMPLLMYINENNQPQSVINIKEKKKQCNKHQREKTSSVINIKENSHGVINLKEKQPQCNKHQRETISVTRGSQEPVSFTWL